MSRIFNISVLLLLLFVLVCEAQSQPIQTWTAGLVHQTIKSKNSNYNGGAVFMIEEGQVTALDLTKASVSDLSFLRSMPTVTLLDLRGLPIQDLTPLKGLPLQALGLEDTNVEDVTQLQGMSLERLYLNNTKVKDISPLSGMPLKLLNLYGTAVSGVSPLATMKQLTFLWLNETPVSDISSLSACPLVSVTLHKTMVRDLSPLSKVTTLERLHIAETPVTDLTPIKHLKLTRLIYSPNNITKGMEIPKEVKSLREIGTTFENRMPPQVFWELYEQGTFTE